MRIGWISNSCNFYVNMVYVMPSSSTCYTFWTQPLTHCPWGWHILPMAVVIVGIKMVWLIVVWISKSTMVAHVWKHSKIKIKGIWTKCYFMRWCVGKMVIISVNSGVPPFQCQVIIQSKTKLSLIAWLGTNGFEHKFYAGEQHYKLSSKPIVYNQGNVLVWTFHPRGPRHFAPGRDDFNNL